MPMLHVKLTSVYSAALTERLKETFSAVIIGITGLKPSAFTIKVDVSESDEDLVAADPTILVRDYLNAMQQRQLEKAQSYIDENFIITFPGSGELTSLHQVVEWSKGRYRFVKKALGSINVAYQTDKIIIFVDGTLSGEWPNGDVFDKVRFIDKFEIRNNLLIRQDVWNDLENAKP